MKFAELYAPNSGHQTRAADPQYDVEEEWACSIRDAEDNTIASVYGASCDEARARAEQIVSALKKADVAERLAEVVRDIVDDGPDEDEIADAIAIGRADAVLPFVKAREILAAWNEAKAS